MTAEKKIAHQRLTLLQVAERIRNVSEACRRHGVSRSQFYEYKRAFQERGLEGLIDQLPIPKSFPNETPPEVREKIISSSLLHPAWGPLRLSDQLRLEGITVSPSTVRNLWLKEGMETKYKRLLRLEEEKNGQDVELTAEQIRLLEKANPCFRERKVESRYPGYLLCQDTFLVGTLKGIGRIYMQAVVDTYGSFAFGKLYTSKLPETAVDVLYDRVMPFYESQGIPVEHILTDNGREYCGRPMIHPYQIFLEFSDIEHRRTKVARPRTKASWSDSIGPSSTSSSGRPSGRSSTPRSRNCRQIWISGFTATTTRGHIGAIATWADGQLKPSKLASLSENRGR
jgi:transposase-like protein